VGAKAKGRAIAGAALFQFPRSLVEAILADRNNGTSKMVCPGAGSRA
jgi:hypothetical protein